MPFRNVALSIIALSMLLAFNGCQQRGPSTPLHLCVLVDVSASIEPEARASMFSAVENIFPHLRRGDTLAIIPITGDAEGETQGKILRFELPKNRQVYDQDLRRLGAQARKALEDMEKLAAADPGARTDILGALRLAAQEVTEHTRTGIIALSDLIQDDAQFDFKRNTNMANSQRAQSLAVMLAARSESTLTDVPVYLGQLRSRDFKLLSRNRRAGIEAFWRH